MIRIYGPATWPALVYSVAASSNSPLSRLSRAKVTRVGAGACVTCHRHSLPMSNTLPGDSAVGAHPRHYTTPCFRTARQLYSLRGTRAYS